MKKAPATLGIVIACLWARSPSQLFADILLIGLNPPHESLADGKMIGQTTNGKLVVGFSKLK